MSDGDPLEDTPWGDPTRRLLLANERTYLAWWRTGVTSIAVGLGAAKLLPAVTKATEWPYAVIGAGYALLGVLCVLYAERRRREVDRAAHARRWSAPSPLFTTLLSLGAAVLGLALLVVVLASP